MSEVFTLQAVPFKRTGLVIPVLSSRNIALSDQEQILESDGEMEVVLHLLLRAKVNFEGKGFISLVRWGPGGFTIDPEDGVLLNNGVASWKVPAQYRGCTLYERGPDNWGLIGGVK